METPAITSGHDFALRPDQDRRQQGGFGQSGQRRQQKPAPADQRASGPAGSIGDLLGEALWQYQDDARPFSVSV